MKKLIFASVLSMVGFITMAQDGITEETKDGISAVETVQDFQEISVSDLPDAVKAAVANDYPTAKITKAYKNASDIYKIEVSMEDGSSGALHADAEGNWVKA